MSIIEAIVLGLVQGLTEFIPISSTAHLEIVPVLLGWGDPGAAASAVIQFGTLLAAIIYFFRDIVRLIAGFFRGLITRRPLADVDSREAWLVDHRHDSDRHPRAAAEEAHRVDVSRAVGHHDDGDLRRDPDAARGAATRSARSCGVRSRSRSTDAVAIGLGQCLALIPGSSRSGSTIMTGALPQDRSPDRRALLVPALDSGGRRRGLAGADQGAPSPRRRSDGPRSSSRSSSPSSPATRRSGSCCAT